VIICAEKQFLTNKAGEFLKDISYHQIDTGIAGEHLVLRATELGLGTCWVGWFDEKAVRKILYIPRHIKVLSLIAAGYYDEQAQPEKAGKRRLEEILFWDAYGQRGE
jgi:nitroreductase